MRLTPPLQSHLLTMMDWFADAQQVSDWAGPGVRFPYDLASFTADLQLETLSSYVLLSDDNDLLGFGQYYKRLNRCHLGRLVISPDKRGTGMAAVLIKALCSKGLGEIGTTELSLFVLAHNTSGIKAYQKFGFALASYPEQMPLENCLYMVKSNQ
ncbi:GNAT family N-acetyltransferase [Paraglaciecola sp. 2405UD69-4]|uniref:GNAT family N-acetyltransferase n=1 Tax=Paraglaciecola sp. 2405UD69-4 TaxID=3391836 RepID=UPI0039C95122